MSDNLSAEQMFCQLCDHLKDNPQADMCANCFTELSLDAIEGDGDLIADDFDDQYQGHDR